MSSDGKDTADELRGVENMRRSFPKAKLNFFGRMCMGSWGIWCVNFKKTLR